MTITIGNLGVGDNPPVGTIIGMLTGTDTRGKVIPCNFVHPNGCTFSAWIVVILT